MTDTSWKGKGEALPRRSPRKRGKTCGRFFKAPRQVEETLEATVQEIILITDTETQTNDSQVQVITETENAREIQARVVGKAVIIPYNKGTKAMSEREADEVARHGEVLRWSTDSENEEVTNRGAERTFESDTTGSTPDCCKSPDKMAVLVTGEIVQVQEFEIQARQHKTKLNYEGQRRQRHKIAMMTATIMFL
jgi:hypothetical protein